MMSGYHVEAADNGERALEIATTLLPDIVLLDINMPAMDGFDTCTLLRRTNARVKSPLFLSVRWITLRKKPKHSASGEWITS